MKAWERIRKARMDLTDYVIHWIRGEFNILMEILRCGYLKPSFAIKYSTLVGTSRPTIRGPYPAVCFTEQTLECFVTSCKVLPSRYRLYGIVFDKKDLYDYGGRPVIYGSTDLLESLPLEYQYLWVRYDPIPLSGYPIDWTHEREWRARVKTPYYCVVDSLPKEGVPLLLPRDFLDNQEGESTPRFKILVAEKEEVKRLRYLIGILIQGWREKCENKYLKVYFERLPQIGVIALEEVKEHLEAGKKEWSRFETLPKTLETLSELETDF